MPFHQNILIGSTIHKEHLLTVTTNVSGQLCSCKWLTVISTGRLAQEQINMIHVRSCDEEKHFIHITIIEKARCESSSTVSWTIAIRSLRCFSPLDCSMRGRSGQSSTTKFRNIEFWSLPSVRLVLRSGSTMLSLQNSIFNHEQIFPQKNEGENHPRQEQCEFYKVVVSKIFLTCNVVAAARAPLSLLLFTGNHSPRLSTSLLLTIWLPFPFRFPTMMVQVRCICCNLRCAFPGCRDATFVEMGNLSPSFWHFAVPFVSRRVPQVSAPPSSNKIKIILCRGIR